MWRRSKLSIRTTRVGVPLPRRHNVMLFSSSANDKTVATFSAMQQQLEFCCLVSGWDTPCATCPFDWRGFDPKERYRILRRTPLAANEVDDAKTVLGIAVTQTLSIKIVKSAFRRQALQWHPDCNQEPEAEERFREILDAYELLLAIVSPP